MAGPTSKFWQERFEKNETGWDRGGTSPQLLAWLNSGVATLPNWRSGLRQRLEVAELAKRGFDVIGLDYTAAAVEKTRSLVEAQGLKAKVLQTDVLSYQPEAKFDSMPPYAKVLHPNHSHKLCASASRSVSPSFSYAEHL